MIRALVLALLAVLGSIAERPGGGPEQQFGPEIVPVRIESRVTDVSDAELSSLVISTLGDPRGWAAAGFTFVESSDAPYLIVLAEPAEVDALCSPLATRGAVSCQNGPTVALNAQRWRAGTSDWDRGLAEYRRYLVNHEVGHLIGQRHPQPRCPQPGSPNAVMEQQTKGLAGCTANVWPLPWEIERAQGRPVVYAPPPEWGPSPVPVNLGGAFADSDQPEEVTTTNTSAPAPSTTSEPSIPAQAAASRPSLQSAPVLDRAQVSTNASKAPMPLLAGGFGLVFVAGVVFSLLAKSRSAGGSAPYGARAAPDARWNIRRRDGAEVECHSVGGVTWFATHEVDELHERLAGLDPAQPFSTADFRSLLDELYPAPSVTDGVAVALLRPDEAGATVAVLGGAEMRFRRAGRPIESQTNAVLRLGTRNRPVRVALSIPARPEGAASTPPAILAVYEDRSANDVGGDPNGRATPVVNAGATQCQRKEGDSNPRDP